MLFLDTFKRLSNIIEAYNEELFPHLKLIVHFDKLTPDEKLKIVELKKKIEIFSFDEFLVNT